MKGLLYSVCLSVIQEVERSAVLTLADLLDQIEKFVSLGLNFKQVCIVMKRFKSMHVILVGRPQLTVVHGDNC